MEKEVNVNPPEPQETPAQVPTPQANPTPTAAPVAQTGGNGSNLKVIGIVVGIVALVGISILGYGTYNGSKIKKYAEDSEKMFSVTNNWGDSFTGSDMTQLKKDIAKVKSDSTESLATLAKNPAPSKAKKLQTDLVEYFTISKKLASDIEGIVDWAVEIEKIGKDLGDLGSLNSASEEALAASIDSQKKEIDSTIEKMNDLTVPDSLKDQHTAFKKLLKSLSKVYGDLSTALKANDLAGVTAASNEFTSAMSDINDIESPEKSIEKAYKDDADKIDSLKTSINNEIIELKKTGFSL